MTVTATQIAVLKPSDEHGFDFDVEDLVVDFEPVDAGVVRTLGTSLAMTILGVLSLATWVRRRAVR